ncbi:MAG: DUF998 domain-containing protein [Anaerolineales bacterium]|nr:DUF998 domain-containing protein [Anaerolineales bacterium]
MTKRFRVGQRNYLLYLSGMIAPLIFIFTAILGGVLRPGYSHLADTVSELFSPGSPNKLLLDIFHTIYALLLILFGIGILQFIQSRDHSNWIGRLGAWLYITMGILSVGTATIFPQDPWGSPPTFPGEMHINLSGILSIITIISMGLIGAWFNKIGLMPHFWKFTWVIVGLTTLSAGFYVSNLSTPIMGLTERITIIIGFSWTFILAQWLYRSTVTTNGVRIRPNQ